ncbi:MAG: DNA starvation/stationary phase protection protein [Chloroflexota bacterium]|nr:DNA starvation/stationary phase protection protein [Chloroflexota bacterium]
MSTTKMKAPGKKGMNGTDGKEATPVMHQRGREIQRYGTVTAMPVGVPTAARQANCATLNQLLADTITLYSLYKKAHWQVKGHTFYQLHLLFDKHAEEQLELVDMIAERIQMLGGVATGMPAAVARLSKIENPPDGVEEVPVVISRLLEAHEAICNEVNEAIDQTEENKDWGTNDMLMGDVLRTNQMQVWFVGENLVDTPLVHA